MNDQLTTHRFVAVLNKKIPVGNLMNALGHMAVGFSALYPDTEVLKFDNYIDKDGGEHPSISDNPFIVLSADNSNQIRTLRNALKENNISFTDFTSTMTVGTFAEQKQKTSETPELELEYYGICFFGENNQLIWISLFIFLLPHAPVFSRLALIPAITLSRIICR